MTMIPHHTQSAIALWMCATAACTSRTALEGVLPANGDPDPCSAIDCSGHGVCEIEAGTPSCQCDANYHAVGSSCVENLVLSIEPVYPNNGAQWLDFVADDGPDELTASDTACPPGTSDACLHGGELRRVEVPGLSSCEGLRAHDDLDLFTWVCQEESNVVFSSVALKLGHGLADLLDSSGFRHNRVVVEQAGQNIAATPLSVWWNNPVHPLPDNGSSGTDAHLRIDDTTNDPGDILVLSASRDSQGYTLDLDRIAVVVLPGAVLRYGGASALNCRSLDADGTPDARCLLAIGDNSFAWIEGELDGYHATSPAAFGVLLTGVDHARLHRVLVSGTADPGDTVTDNGGVRLDNSHRVHVDFTNASGNGGNGISTRSCDHLWLHHVTAFNNLDYGIQLHSGSHAVLTHVTIANNLRIGLYVSWWVTDATLSFVTVANSTSNGGITIGNNCQRATAHNLVAANTGGDAFALWSGSVGFTGSHLVAAHGAVHGFYLSSVEDAYFAGNLLVGSTSTGPDSDCHVTSPAGVVELADDCSSPTANVVRGIDLSDTFVGKVGPPGDSANTSDTDGTAAYTYDLDWFQFDDPQRGWGRDGAAFADSSNRGDCRSGTCRIWDWRLTDVADNPLRNRTGDGTTANPAYSLTTPETCPALLHGDVAVTDHKSTASTYLLNAEEALLDGVGDDDGLCESQEACIYAPNFGAYQGTGEYLAHPCTFEDGVVSQVAMYAYPVN